MDEIRKLLVFFIKLWDFDSFLIFMSYIFSSLSIDHVNQDKMMVTMEGTMATEMGLLQGALPTLVGLEEPSCNYSEMAIP